MGAVPSPAAHADLLDACDALVVAFVRDVAPYAHLGLDQWQVRFASERPAIQGAGLVPLRTGKGDRFVGLAGVAVGVVARERTSDLTKGIIGRETNDLYRAPPTAAEATQALGTCLRDGDLSVVPLPAGALAATGAFEASALPGELLPGPERWMSIATIPVRVPNTILTRGRTMHVPPDVVFLGSAGPGSLATVGAVALAPLLLYPPPSTLKSEQLRAANVAGHALVVYDGCFRLRDYDIGGFGRRREIARALDAEAAEVWQGMLPAGAAITLARDLAARSQADAVTRGYAGEAAVALLRRNLMLAAVDACLAVSKKMRKRVVAAVATGMPVAR